MEARATVAVALALALVRAGAQTPATGGIGTGNWGSFTPQRGVHVALRATESPEGPSGIFCAHRNDGTTLGVPWGTDEPIPPGNVGNNVIVVDALGASFGFRRDGDLITHRVIQNGKAREGHHTLAPATVLACALPTLDPHTEDSRHALTGSWRGVYHAPEGPAIEIQIGGEKDGVPSGTVCLANGNGSMVYWSLESVGTRAVDTTSLQWTRAPAPAALKERTTYDLQAIDDDRALLTISTKKRRTIKLRRGLSSRGCTAALSTP